MNKQEAQKEIEKNNQTIAQNKEENKFLKKANKQLQEMIDSEPDTSELVFEPKHGDKFYYIGDYASNRVAEDRFHFDKDMNKLLKVGNCFRTEEDAKNSAKYYFMNSEYDYWLPWSGQPKPKVLPKGLEFWNLNYGEWDDSGYKDPSLLDNRHVYRWKRSEQ